MAKRSSNSNFGVPKAPSNTKTIVLGALGVLVALLLAAVALAQGGDDDSNGGSEAETVQYQSVATTGSPLPPVPESGVDPAVAQVAPELRGKSFTGQAVDVTADGKAKAVMFFAHWCPHCQRELPEVSRYVQENRSRADVELVSVATGTSPQRPNFPPSQWFSEENYPLPVMADSRDATAGNAFGLSGYPFMVFLDGQNRVVSRVSGEIGAAELANRVQQAVDATAGAPAGSTTTGAPAGPSSPAS